MPNRKSFYLQWLEDPHFREKWRAYRREYMKRNRHKYAASRPQAMANRREEIKNAVINVLTGGEGTCRACGQGDQDVLCIDHVNNDGSEHRKTTPSSNGRIWQWLVNNDYPTGFQVLCYNCNMKKEILRRRTKREMVCQKAS